MNPANTISNGNSVRFFSLSALILGCAGSVIAAPPLVTDQTAAVGLDVSHVTVFHGPDMEFMAAGGAAGDFDNDGDQDLFILGGSGSFDHLYINDGTGHFTDQGAAAGIDRTHRGTGVAVGDYDNDGDLDVYVTSIGLAEANSPGHNILWSNNGDGTFTDVTAIAGVSTNNAFSGDAFSASFGDYDLDGDLDLAVAGWLGGNVLYQNNGDGTFTDVVSTAFEPDVFGVDTSTYTRGFSPRFVDMNGDRYPELLWVSDFYTSHYFINNTDGTFTDGTVAAGTGLDSNGMGNTYGDYNGDGVYDWYAVSRIAHGSVPSPGNSGNMLYMGTQVPHVFVESSEERGCNFGYWGWAATSVDMNHDGALDIFAVNGFNGAFANDPSILFLNDGTGNFVDVASVCGMTDAGAGRGVINADFDNDGDQDVVVLNDDEEMVYYRNEIAGTGTNSITLDFNTSAVDTLAPNGFGTHVRVVSASHNQMRYLDGGTNYLSQSELSVHVGLGSDTTAAVTIEWANGDIDVYPSVAPGKYTLTAFACAGDLTLDGSVNFFDVSLFLSLFLDQHPQGDLTQDGAYNFFDVSAFLQAYGAGCP